jgi:hypothetical protein
MALTPTAITISLEDPLEDALMKMTTMVVLGHEFRGVNPGALDSCPGISDNHVGSILIDSAFRLIQSDPNNNWGCAFYILAIWCNKIRRRPTTIL